MTSMPLMLIPIWLLGLLSVALLGGGGYLLYAWYVGAVGTGYLVASLAMLLLALLGRPLVLLFLRPDPDPPKPIREGEVRKVARPDGTELHVELYGSPSAPPLVLTHGWGADGTAWYYTKQALARQVRLIVWDLPGLGRSARRADNNYTVEHMAEDLGAVAALVGDQPVVLAGHSIGGMITLSLCRLLADRLPGRVAGIALIHTTHTNPVHTTSWSGLMRVLQTPVLTPLLYLMIGLSPLVYLMNWLAYLNGSLHLSALWSGFVAPTRQQLEFATCFNARAWPGVVARGMLGMFRYDETAALPGINVPALVLAAERDPLLPPDRSSEVLRERLPQAEYAELRAAKHMGLIEQHERFNAVLAEFVRKCASQVQRV